MSHRFLGSFFICGLTRYFVRSKKHTISYGHSGRVVEVSVKEEVKGAERPGKGVEFSVEKGAESCISFSIPPSNFLICVA